MISVDTGDAGDHSLMATGVHSCREPYNTWNRSRQSNDDAIFSIRIHVMACGGEESNGYE